MLNRPAKVLEAVARLPNKSDPSGRSCSADNNPSSRSPENLANNIFHSPSSSSPQNKRDQSQNNEKQSL